MKIFVIFVFLIIPVVNFSQTYINFNYGFDVNYSSDDYPNRILGAVKALDKLIVYGKFSKVGKLSGGIASLDENGNHDSTFPRTDGIVYSIKPDDNNFIWVGGKFNYVNGILKENIVKINSNYKVDESWKGFTNGVVKSILTHDNYVYIGGDFTKVNGIKRNRIARLFKTDGSLDTNWDPDINGGEVLTMEISNNDLFVGGSFTKVGNTYINYLVKLNLNTGQVVNDWNLIINLNNGNYVSKILIYKDDLIISGNYQKVNNTISNNNVLRIKASNGAFRENWYCGASALKGDMLISESYLYIPSTSKRYHLTDGNNDSNWKITTGPYGNLRSNVSLIRGNKLFICGSILFLENNDNYSTIRYGITKYDIDQQRFDSSLNIEPHTTYSYSHENKSEIYCIAEFGGRIIIGGNIELVNCQTRNNIAAFDFENGNLLDWNPNISGTTSPNKSNEVRSVLNLGDYIYAAGHFTKVGDRSRYHLAKISLVTGLIDDSWDPFPDFEVNKIFLANNSLYVIGYFRNIGGAERNNVARIDLLTGKADQSWKLNMESNIPKSCSIDNEYLYLSIFSTKINNILKNGLVRFRLMDGQFDEGWNINPTGKPDQNATTSPYISPFFIYGNNIFLSGFYTHLNNQSCKKIVKFLKKDAKLDTNFKFNYENYGWTSQIITDNEDDIIISGGGSNWPFSNVFLLNSNNGEIDSSWFLCKTSVSTLALNGTRLFMGGNGNFKTCLNNFILGFAVVRLTPKITIYNNKIIICKDVPASIQFSVKGNYDSGNIFHVQLSDKNGNFDNFLNIGEQSGTTSGNISIFIPKYIESGLYKIRIVSTHPYSISSNIIEIQVIEKPKPIITGPSSVCTNSINVYKSNTTEGITFKWIVTGGEIIGSDTSNQVIIKWKDSGDQTCKLIHFVKNSDCSDSTIIPILVYQSPKPLITGEFAICARSTHTYYSEYIIGLEYKWIVTGGIIDGSSTANSITVRWSSPGTGIIKLVQKISFTGCIDSIIKIVNILPPPYPEILGSTEVTENTTELYTTKVSSGITSSWYVEGGQIQGSSNSNTVQILWGSVGLAKLKVVQVNNKTGCTDSAYKEINIVKGPKINISGLFSVCENSIEFYSTTSSIEFSNKWSVVGGDIEGSSVSNIIQVRWGLAGKGVLKLVQENKIKSTVDSLIKLIIINPVPPKPSITRDSNFLISSSEYGNQWYLDGEKISEANEKKYEPLKPGFYQVIVKDSNGCDSEISNPFNFGINDIQNLVSQKYSIKFYPNPFSGKLNFEMINRHFNIIVLEIRNMFGNIIYKKEYSSDLIYIKESLDLSGYSSGIYSINLKIENLYYSTKIILVK